jgi:hypothetical protein
MTKRRSPVRVTGPRVSLTKRGLRVTGPRARIGGRSGLNISKSGVSYSVRTKHGTLNTKRGCSRALPGCGLLLMLLAGTTVITVHKIPRSHGRQKHKTV